MDITPVKAICHSMNQYLELIPKFGSQTWFFQGFYASKVLKAHCQAFFDSKNFFYEIFSVSQKWSETCLRSLKNIPECLQTLLGWLGIVLAKLKNLTFEKIFELIFGLFLSYFEG